VFQPFSRTLVVYPPSIISLFMYLPVLRIRNYFFQIRIRGSVNPNHGSGSYPNIFTTYEIYFYLSLFLFGLMQV